MRTGLITIFLFLNSIHLSGCQPKEGNSVLDKYNLKKANGIQITLSPELHEISGVAFSADNRLFVHNDEQGIIFQIELQTGRIVKRFFLGKDHINGDFEDITIIKDEFYLIKSDGTIFEFKEGKDQSYVEYKKYNTGLSKENNIEGMTYDPVNNSLLLACKDFPGQGLDGSRAVYSFSLSHMKLDPKPRFVIPIEPILKRLNVKNFRPSAITRDVKTGNFLILSAHSKVIVEISESGKILDMRELAKKYHPQPEGLSFDKDSRLIISDESDGGGKITAYGR